MTATENRAKTLKAKNTLFNINNVKEKCAYEIIKLLIDNGLWVDTCVYANGKRWGCKDVNGDGRYHYDNTWDCVFVEENINPKEYFEYTGDFLCLSTESEFYYALNHYYYNDLCDTILKPFNNILDKYGKYYEMGDTWNLALYDK